MSESSERLTHIYLGREEIRGLFTLGLLAVVATVRIQYQNREITVLINGMQYVITPFFDVMIILWSFYAFFMVVGISDDIIGQKASKIFRNVSRYYLYFSYLILALMAFYFYYSVYHLQAIGLAIFASTLFIYWVIKKVYLKINGLHNAGLSVTSEFPKLLKKSFKILKSESYQFLASVSGVCLVLVVAGTHEEFIIPSSIIGSVFLILFFIARDRKKKTNSN